jgi:hypothetical protein
MRDICLPLREVENDQPVEVIVNVAGESRKYNFKVETFDWSITDAELADHPYDPYTLRIQKLREAIEKYDKNWEVIQIFDPGKHSNFVQALFRLREKKVN